MVKEKEIKPSEEIKEETVTLKKSELDDIMKRLSRVEYAADNSRTNRFDEKNRGKVGMNVGVRTIDGKIIIKWNMIEDVVKKDTTGEWTEKQTVELTFSDGKTKTYPYAFFASNYQKMICKVIGKSDEDGVATFKVETPEGEKFEIGVLFIN